MHIQSIFPSFLHFFLKKKNKRHEQCIGYFFLVLTVIGGATFPAFARQLSSVLTPLSLLFFGEISIFFFLVCSYGFLPLIRQILCLRRSECLALGILGFSVSLGLLFLFIGYSSTLAINAELLGKAEVIFVLAFSVSVLHESFTRTHALAAACIFLGIALILLRDLNGGFHFHSADSLILLSSFLFSFASILFKKFLQKVHPEVVLFGRSSIAIFLFLLLSPIHQHPFLQEIFSLPPVLFPVLLCFAFLSRFLSVLSFYESIERLPLTVVFLFLPLSTVFALLFAYLYLGEVLRWMHIVGAFSILCGIGVLNVFGATKIPRKELLAHLKQHPRHHI